MSDFKTHWQTRAVSAEFKQKLKELNERAFREFLDIPMVEMLQFIEWQLEKFPLDKSWHDAFDKMGRDIHDMVSARVKEANLAPDEILDAKTIAAWRQVVSRPLELDDKTVASIVDAPAVKDLFVTVIHDAIIEFNKKFNPFFGGLAAFGLDKQIKEFIVPFMGHITEIAKNFILNPANRSKMAEFNQIVFDLVMSQKPQFFYNLSTPEGDEAIIAALHQGFRDEQLKIYLLDILRKYRGDVEAKHGQKSLAAYFAESGITPVPPKVSDAEIDYIAQKLAMSETAVWFLSGEIAAYKK